MSPSSRHTSRLAVQRLVGFASAVLEPAVIIGGFLPRSASRLPHILRILVLLILKSRYIPFHPELVESTVLQGPDVGRQSIDHMRVDVVFEAKHLGQGGWVVLGAHHQRPRCIVPEFYHHLYLVLRR